MSKTDVIRTRIEPGLKQEVENIFKELGLTTTEAINLFYRQVRLRKGLPFEVRIPNPVTIQTLKDTDNGENVVDCEDAEDMFDKLGI